MSFSLYGCSIPAFIHSLNNLSGLLEHAETHSVAHGIDEAVLTSSRLYPNMLPLTKQVQIACDIVKLAAARMADVTPPTHEDNETTFTQLKARVESTKTFLNTILPEHIKGAEDKTIVMQAGPHQLTFNGADYVNCWALPNLYFHVATAYYILRHNGVSLGKADFLGVSAFKTTPA
jgi:hypothetical protein